ncbi:MAG: type II/IV secretion system protein, partial [Candidatus Sungbacteria bacterium]|nr:type II/IV secretion system protein [Candidatus Sungbacteria bacterium]
VLVSAGVLSLEEVSGIKSAAKKKGVTAEEMLYERGVSEEVVLQAKGEVFGLPVKKLPGAKIEFNVLRQVPEESARFYKFVPLGEEAGFFEIGMMNPDDTSAQQALKFISGRVKKPFKIFLISPSDFQAVLQEYKSIGGEVTKALSEFEREAEADVLQSASKKAKGKENGLMEEAPITKIVDVIVKHGVEGRASDIHIEPQVDVLRVRFRVDGVLRTGLTLPLSAHAPIVNRVKILTKMKIDENRVPQDGRFHMEVNGKGVDFRVATLPTPFGEKVAIRILDPEAGVKTLEDLGFIGRNLTIIQEAMKRPYGMILITGPTGSGKSTTLYAMLQILNREGVNVISLEDPIEYFMAGLNQSQIRPEIGYDFATGLRNILRQDPDIIMVGEIRDKETAQLATQAALTGHLVLSTLHTNDAKGVIPRLIDMGVDPFLLPSTLILAVAQRLTRKLCVDSKKPVEGGSTIQFVDNEVAQMPEPVRKLLEAQKPWTIYKSQESPSCPSGTSGRLGIFETLAMTPELQKIIGEGASEAKVEKEAERQQMLTMRQDGILKVINGVIGLEELLEVT